MTRTAFADFCAEQDARNTIQLNVTKWTLMLCDALKQDYIRYAIESHNNAIFHADAGDSYSVNYHKTCIEELKNGQCDYDFTFESGRKYHKVIMNAHGSRSVHCFIDKKTGEIYKSSSWKSPAKGVRYDLRIIEEREWVLENADWASSYLYAK
jgi:hypothetical protein